MDSGLTCRPMGRQLRTSAPSLRTDRAKACSLVARATAVRHGLLGQLGGQVLGGGHGIVERNLHLQQQHHTDADRNTLVSVQLPQDQPSLSRADPAAYDYTPHAPARKPTAWVIDSHTRPANSRLAAYGCYRVVGPARISKRGDTLVAHMFRGSRIELLDRDGNATPYGSVEQPDLTPSSSVSSWASASEDGGACDPGGDPDFVSECVLVAAHVELCGSACSVDLVDLSAQPAVHHHNGHTYVSVRSLPPGTVIQLGADAHLRHPINITPTPPPEAA